MYGNLLIIHGDRPRVLPQQRLGSSTGGFSEQWLRDQLFDHPEILPFAELDGSYSGSVAICREMRTEAGPIDAVFANEHGLITILECKLWRNPEARREVVGQVLDYARAMARLTYEDLSRQVNAALRTEGNRLFDLVKARHRDVEEHVWVDQVSRNLSQGRFLLLVVGDGIREGVVAITEQLQRGVGLRFQFGLVEVAVFSDKTPPLTILQPRLLARTVNVERSVVRIESATTPPATASIVDVDDADTIEGDPTHDSGVAGVRKAFWSKFITSVKLEGGTDATPRRLQQNSAKARLPLGQWVTAYRGESVGRIGVFYVTRGDQAREIVRCLNSRRKEIESEIGVSVTWESSPTEIHISASRDESDFESAAALERQHQWLAKQLKGLTRGIGPSLRTLEHDLDAD